MRPHLGDARLEVFADWHDKAENELGGLFRRILEGRTAARPLVSRALNDLASATIIWARGSFEEIASEADFAASDALGVDKALYYGHLVNALQMEMIDRLSRARNSIMSLANQLARRPDLAQRITNEFTTVPVRITGASGRSYTYPLSYYSTMVAHTVSGRLKSAVTLHRAVSTGYPYVQVTDEHSDERDYCTAYRGRVFDINGDKEIYPSLSRTPAGGPPFHPWCSHSLQIYTPKGTDVPPEMDERFLLSDGETTHYGILKRWKERND